MTFPIPIATRQFLSDSQPLSPEPLVAIFGTYQFPWIFNQSDSAGSSDNHPSHHEGPDMLNYPETVPFPVTPYHSPSVTPGSALGFCYFSCFAVALARQVSPPQFLFARSCRLPHFSWLFLLLTITPLFSLLTNSLFGFVHFCPFMSQMVCIVTFLVLLVFLVP